MKIVKYASTALSALCIIGIAFIANAEIQSIEEQDMLQDYAEQHHCLALNIYHEARSDSALGQKAVAYVTLNRVQSSKYPDTICDVVYQTRLDANGNPKRNQCQFSWYCDGKDDTPLNMGAWYSAEEIANTAMTEFGVAEDFTAGAIMYHAAYANPYWTDSYEKTVRIDTHIFYK